jgi:hypothetical protein
MRVVELRELSRRESPVHYIKELTAVAVIEWNAKKSESDIAITLEHKPVGPPEVHIHLLESVDWPALSVIHAIKEYVVELEHTGRLP